MSGKIVFEQDNYQPVKAKNLDNSSLILPDSSCYARNDHIINTMFHRVKSFYCDNDKTPIADAANLSMHDLKLSEVFLVI